MTFQPEPFVINISDEDIIDLRERLSRTRFPDELEDSGWQYGTPLDWMKEHVEYWRTGFDWRKSEAEINSFSNFKIQIEDIDLHFIHEKSSDPNAIPLILSHGWPGSFYEFHKVIDPLAHPKKYGLTDMPAFHVVVPSLPGYGFSSAPRKKGFTIEDTARIFNTLMQGLGYTRYAAQGGDWGSIVTRFLAVNHSDNCKVIHLNFCPAPIPDAFSYVPQRVIFDYWPSLILNTKERANLHRSMEWEKKGTGYYSIQSSKPQTLAYGTTDSPAGLLGWIGEKLGRDSVTRDELLTDISIYWFSGNIASTYRTYKENLYFREYLRSKPVSIPAGVSIFPKEIMITPKSWVAYSVNLQWYKENERGGHFAAMEEPQLFADNLRACFAKIWRQGSKI